MARMPMTHPQMPGAAVPEAATPEDASPIGRILARAFGDDPMMRWFFPVFSGSQTREADLGRYFATLFTRQYVRHGVCERTPSAAAFWVPPGAQHEAVPDAETVEQLAEILGDRAPLFREAAAAAAGQAPREPHWYLAVLGADPAAQGRGHGAALLRSGLAKADATGLPTYLESSKAENIPFYGHFGFMVLGEVRLPGGGPPLWVMRRAPAWQAGA
ncbi:GNAT family N-acetyltransferase [Streptomyces sp. NPDC046465]|uniref:GNAT family N-acetyltransferase n=1 Tax=Streptomyces sp. NPDC046465 TaxID=3155810 RepID=UPI0033E52A45